MAEKVFIPGAVDAVMHIETDGVIHVEHVQDCQKILDYTHAMRNQRYSGMSREGFVGHVAEVPFVLMQKWANEAGCAPLSDEMSAIVERKLAQPEYAHLLAAPKLNDPRIIVRGAK